MLTGKQPVCAGGLPVSADSVLADGAVLRVFGRSLAWTANGCVDARARGASAKTLLALTPLRGLPGAVGGNAEGATMTKTTPTRVPAQNASCFEAAFVLSNIPAGRYNASLLTAWGESRSWVLTLSGAPAPPPVRKELNVDADFGGDVAKALAHAATLAQGATVTLASRVYMLTQSLSLPDNTVLRGAGKAQTSLSFAFSSTMPDIGCSAPIPNLDLYRKGANHFRDLSYIPNVSSIADCCRRCGVDLDCNAYAMMDNEDQCVLKACDLNDQASCAASGSPDSDRTAGFLTPFRRFVAASAAIVTASNSSLWGLEDFTLEITEAPPKMKGVLARGSDFAIRRLSIQLRQKNATSAVKVDVARRFEIVSTLMVQHNLCFWGCTLNHATNTSVCSMNDAGTDFQDSSTLQIHNASHGHIHKNKLLWRCSGYDMDVSSNMIFESNNLTSTEAGVLPHGNSVSFYDFQHVPTSENWSFSHNYMARPPHNDPHNWAFHETFTGDGSGGFGAGPILDIASEGTAVTLGFALRSSAQGPIGGSVMVCGGGGLGQHSVIVGVSSRPSDNATVLMLATALDGHVAAGLSTLCLTATVGSKIVSGNSFNWGMVVQWFGTTFRGVISDNNFTDMNVCSSGYGCKNGDGALESFGLCYNGPEPMWMSEYEGNHLVRSNGISLKDDVVDTALCNASSYGGPFTRWQVIRRNSIAGVAESQTECGTIRLSGGNVSTDVVVEGNTFDCPAGKTQPAISVNCSHCRVQPTTTAAAAAAVPDHYMYLQSVIVTLASDAASGRTSVLAMGSRDGKLWEYIGPIATAADFPLSQEGANEMDLAWLPGNKAILAMIRMDGGDGPKTHPYVPYHRSVSTDRGITWSKAKPVDAGCARPRLLQLGSVMLMSGGRMRNKNTSDVLMWSSTDGQGETWTEHSLSAAHNAGETDPTLRYDANVNSTTFGPRETNSYTSLVQLTENTALVTYDQIFQTHVNTTHEVTRCCSAWPVPGNESKAGCEAGGDAKNDGGVYHYNTGRGTPAAACGEKAECWCCRTAKDDVVMADRTFAMAVTFG